MFFLKGDLLAFWYVTNIGNNSNNVFSLSDKSGRSSKYPLLRANQITKMFASYLIMDGHYQMFNSVLFL